MVGLRAFGGFQVQLTRRDDRFLAISPNGRHILSESLRLPTTLFTFINFHVLYIFSRIWELEADFSIRFTFLSLQSHTHH